jgi:hypothetical protein
MLTRHHSWIREHGEDMPEVANWTWPGAIPAAAAVIADDAPATTAVTAQAPAADAPAGGIAE